MCSRTPPVGGVLEAAACAVPMVWLSAQMLKNVRLKVPGIDSVSPAPLTCTLV